MTKKEFIQACLEENITLTDNQINQFETYKHILLEWNEKMNLTAITKEEEIWEKHFYDSISPFFGMKFQTLCDVGSGAGFPGIPVKIIYPQIELTLIEPLQKRCRFLEEVTKQLDLKKVNILSVRAEDFGKKNREVFDVVSARAVANLSILLELCVPLVKVNGYMVALKGKNGHLELESSSKAIEILDLELEKEESFDLDQGSRINLYFRKMKKTSNKYPRAYGQIKKKPLGD